MTNPHATKIALGRQAARLDRRVNHLKEMVRDLEDRMALAEQAMKQLIIVGGLVPKNR